jgi:hypothetical protein
VDQVAVVLVVELQMVQMEPLIPVVAVVQAGTIIQVTFPVAPEAQVL